MADIPEIWRDWFTVPPSPAGRGIRRCAEGHLVRSLPAPCPVCGGLTVGRALDRVYTGEDEIAAGDVARREVMRGKFVILAGAVWALAGLRVLYWLVFNGALSALFALVSSVIIALVFQALIATVIRAILSAIAGRATHGAHVSDLHAKLDDFADRIMDPFLARNGIGENGRIHVAPEELALLEQAFAHEELVPRHGSIPALLAAAALRRDLRRFRERLVAAEAGDWFLAYARIAPDEKLIPFLEEVLFEEGLDPAGAAEQVQQRRSGKKLETFLTDLEQRRGSDPVVVTIDALDGLDAGSFESLVQMMLESEGYARRGLALERHGEKLLLHARPSIEPLDTPVVQGTLVEKAEVGCEHALIATNATFTDAARALARGNKIELVDRKALEVRLEAFNKAPKDYARLATLLKPRRA